MGEAIGLIAGLPCNMPFIVSSNIDKLDPTTRKFISRHVMRGKKKRKAHVTGAVGIASADPMQNGRIPPRLQEVLDMYKEIQPGCFGTQQRFVDFPGESEASVLWDIEQGK